MFDTLVVIATMALLAACLLGFRLVGLRHRAARAEELAALRGRSLSLAAQELRGIAGAMTGCRERGDASGPAGVPPRLAMQGPAGQLLHLADDLAEIAADPRQPTLHEVPARLGPVVDAAVARVSTQIRPGTRHWKVDPALRALTVRADRRALEGALAALLRRAASHSGEGDIVVLRWVVASETVAIVVEDEGDGLAALDLVPEATAATCGTRGLDLGLSLARSLAAAHGGDIRLETAPGIGARAWLTLPRARLLEAA